MLRRLLILCLLPLTANAAEHITLRNGFTIDCVRSEVQDSGRVRLFTSEESYVEINADAIASAERFEMPVAAPPVKATVDVSPHATLTEGELSQLLEKAGTAHRVDADLLAAVVRAESNNQPHAVSHAGAQGLMQLMPSTARDLGVTDSFRPEQNINGGSTYLDSLLTRYHDNIALALAAYNAGPAAVDRYHGIPPYTETRAYVARVIREFNRRKTTAHETISQIK